MSREIVLFDAFGTLFDLNLDLALLEQFAKGQSSKLLDLWRIKQLEYTWLFQAMGRYENFSYLSKLALKNVIQHLNIVDESEYILKLLLPLYDSPNSFEDVLPTLTKLKSLGVRSYIFSNGTPAMLSRGIENSGLIDLISGFISVDDIRQYKPSPAVYEYALNRLNSPIESILFVSSNQWDVAGASVAGLDAIWLNRSKTSFENLDHTPYSVIESIEDLIKYIK